MTLNTFHLAGHGGGGSFLQGSFKQLVNLRSDHAWHAKHVS